MLLLNHPCMNNEDLQAYKKHLDDISAENGYTNEHSFCQEDGVVYPALVVSAVSVMPDLKKKVRYICHTALTKARLMKILGLTTEDIQIQFDMKSMPTLPEVVEDREV